MHTASCPQPVFVTVRSGAIARLSRGLVVVLAVVAALLFTGCAAAPDVDNPHAFQASAYGDYFEAAGEVLRDEGFTIDRSDYRFGAITTMPQGSPTLFEPWNDDNTTGDQVGQSTFSDLRRQVTVQLAPVGLASGDAVASVQGPIVTGDYQLSVHVVLERRQEPDRYLTSSTRDQAMMRDYRRTPAELQQQGISGTYWVPVERDTRMERDLLAQILIRAQERQQMAQAAP